MTPQAQIEAESAQISSSFQKTPCEQHIISMSDADYMNDLQLTFFKSRLLAQETVLLVRNKASATEISEGVTAGDPVDRATAEEEHQLAIMARMRDGGQLKEIRAALSRIATGDYGWCSETGEAIGVARLLVCPTAVLSVEAQQRHELKTTRYRSC